MEVVQEGFAAWEAGPGLRVTLSSQPPQSPRRGPQVRCSPQHGYRLFSEFGGWFREHRSILRFSAAALTRPGRCSSRLFLEPAPTSAAFTGHGLPESPGCPLQAVESCWSPWSCPSLGSLLGISITQLCPSHLRWAEIRATCKHQLRVGHGGHTGEDASTALCQSWQPLKPLLKIQY